MLIIYAHPNRDGHCGYILQRVTEALDKKSVPYELLDLYAIDYDPVLKSNELYSAGKKSIAPENQALQEKIKSASKFIFIYPTWWNAPPAILKGFVDRVFTSGFAFYYKNGRPKPLLVGKKASVLCSCGGPSLLWFNTGAVTFLTQGVLKFCGIQSKAFLITHATKLTAGQKSKIDRAVRSALDYLA